MGLKVNLDWQTAAAATAAGAAAASLLATPLGLAGGAIYGVCFGVISAVLDAGCKHVFGVDDNTSSGLSRIIAFVGSFFATTAILWAVANAMGIAITFSGALALSGATFGLAIPIAIGIGFVTYFIFCRCCCSAPSEAGDLPSASPPPPGVPSTAAHPPGGGRVGSRGNDPGSYADLARLARGLHVRAEDALSHGPGAGMAPPPHATGRQPTGWEGAHAATPYPVLYAAGNGALHGAPLPPGGGFAVRGRREDPATGGVSALDGGHAPEYTEGGVRVGVAPGDPSAASATEPDRPPQAGAAPVHQRTRTLPPVRPAPGAVPTGRQSPDSDADPAA